jgi:hypothetical protein
MKMLAKLIVGAAALGASALAGAPALADGYYNNGPGWNGPGWSDNGYNQPAPYGYDRPAYGYDRPDYAYDRPAYGAYGGPAYEVGSGAIAVCPAGYHLGRGGALCWPN